MRRICKILGRPHVENPRPAAPIMDFCRASARARRPSQPASFVMSRRIKSVRNSPRVERRRWRRDTLVEGRNSTAGALYELLRTRSRRGPARRGPGPPEHGARASALELGSSRARGAPRALVRRRPPNRGAAAARVPGEVVAARVPPHARPVVLVRDRVVDGVRGLAARGAGGGVDRLVRDGFGAAAARGRVRRPGGPAGRGGAASGRAPGELVVQRREAQQDQARQADALAAEVVQHSGRHV